MGIMSTKLYFWIVYRKSGGWLVLCLGVRSDARYRGRIGASYAAPVGVNPMRVLIKFYGWVGFARFAHTRREPLPKSAAQPINKNYNPNNPTPCRFVRTLPRCSQQLLSYESGGRYPALPAAQSMTTPMLATTTPMLATNNYYQARLDCVEAKKNRPRTPKRPRPDTARRPQGLADVLRELKPSMDISTMNTLIGFAELKKPIIRLMIVTRNFCQCDTLIALRHSHEHKHFNKTEHKILQ